MQRIELIDLRHTPRWGHAYDLFRDIRDPVDPDNTCDPCDDITVPAVATVSYYNEDCVPDEVETCWNCIETWLDAYHYDHDGQAVGDVTLYSNVDPYTGEITDVLAAAA